MYFSLSKKKIKNNLRKKKLSTRTFKINFIKSADNATKMTSGAATSVWPSKRTSIYKFNIEACKYTFLSKLQNFSCASVLFLSQNVGSY